MSGRWQRRKQAATRRATRLSETLNRPAGAITARRTYAMIKCSPLALALVCGVAALLWTTSGCTTHKPEPEPDVGVIPEQPEPQPDVDVIPEKLRASIGGYLGDSYTVELRDGSLYYSTKFAGTES